MNQKDTIDLYFEGDLALYAEYAAMCRVQFVLDIESGDKACLEGNVQAMHQLAHSLKTVLLSLGRSDLSEIALAIETCAATADMPSVNEAWRVLRAALPHALD